MLQAAFTILFQLVFALSTAHAQTQTIPHGNTRLQQSFQQYLESDMHRAFAIAPGGIWSWQSNLDTVEEATSTALKDCERRTDYQCTLYALNDDIVFNKEVWTKLWRPYSSNTEAKNARTGRHRGERLHDLRFTDVNGKSLALSDFRGKVILLHFWGTWCPTCIHELPQFPELMRAFKDEPNIAFVFTQMREPYALAQNFLKQQNINLPLYDSGSHEELDNKLTLNTGDKIDDRAVATVYPSTYILDRNGIVVFSMRGSPDNWIQYVEFLQDLLTHKQ